MAAAEPSRDFRQWAASRLAAFLSSDETELRFPSSLSSAERKYAHTQSRKLGLQSKSYGKEPDRYLVVRKQTRSTTAALLKLPADHNIYAAIEAAAQQWRSISTSSTGGEDIDNAAAPQARKRRTVWPPPHQAEQLADDLAKARPRRQDELEATRLALPVHRLGAELLDLVHQNSATLVCGETGCGKTTQVPQILLEDSLQRGYPARIVCTQPRRIAATSVAARVSQEWGCKLGSTIGYSVRLDNCLSNDTRILFCTTAILLRMAVDSTNLSHVTHVIVDEAHERDRFTDFLLILLRRLLLARPNLRVIIMSASLHASLFSEYFGGCPQLDVPGFTHPVKVRYLADVLKVTQRDKMLGGSASSFDPDDAALSNQGSALNVAEFDQIIHDAWHAPANEVEGLMHGLVHCIMSNDIPVDHVHAATGCTALIVAAVRGQLETVQQLLRMGADPTKRAGGGCFSARDLAQQFGHDRVLEALDKAMEVRNDSSAMPLSQQDMQLVSAYHEQFNADDEVDLELIRDLLRHICIPVMPQCQHEAILVFLPGSSEITALLGMLQRDKGFPSGLFTVLPLHSQCSNKDQQRVFKRPSPGVRKIVLATNIAETSVTIDDVVHVIDSGKAKVKKYDWHTQVASLTSGWISRANAIQRRGRAGRCQPGNCWHLFDRTLLATMEEHPTPEMLRSSLDDVCLFAAALQTDARPEELLSLAPDQPNTSLVAQSMDILKCIRALDIDHNITLIGQRLASLSLSPLAARLLLASVALGCLDPILTLVAAGTSKGPFIRPLDPEQQKQAASARRTFFANNSDHCAVIEAFSRYQEAERKGSAHTFCQRYYLNMAAMRHIDGVRRQLLQQLEHVAPLKKGESLSHHGNRRAHNWAAVQSALCYGLYTNLALVEPIDKKQFRISTRGERRAKLHTSSDVRLKDVRWIIFDEIQRGGGLAMVLQCSAVEPITSFYFAGSLSCTIETLSEEPEDEADPSITPAASTCLLKLDEWISFQCSATDAELLADSRAFVQTTLLKLLASKDSVFPTPDVDAIFETIISAGVAKTPPRQAAASPMGAGPPSSFFAQVDPIHGHTSPSQFVPTSVHGALPYYQGRGRGNGRGQRRGRGRGRGSRGGRGRGRGGRAGGGIHGTNAP